MSTLLSQSAAVIKMNIQSLPRRLWMSLAMVFASAVVVAILLAFLAMSKGFEATMESAGSDNVAFFIRTGSAAELNSSAGRDQVNLIENSPGIKRDEQGPMVSPELYVIVDGIKKSTQQEANLPLRGLDQRGVNMRKGFTLVAGRMFNPGTDELIVGAGVVSQFDGFELGQEIRFGKNTWKVVGVFSTGGNVFESELWADAKVIQNLYNRGSSYQSVRAVMESPDSLGAINEYLKSEPRLTHEAQAESSYFAEQGKSLSYMAIFGWVISSIMALGALAGALNTMYTSVSDRAMEIATLRAIGFSSFSAFIGTMAEAMTLAVVGSLVGSLAAFIFFDGLSTSTLGGSFTQVVFSFSLTPELFTKGISMALVIGFISGFFPAWRAARVPVIVAFQSGR
ncbi:ABC transporter permease [Paraglaciecola hydrolytica]|uniref:Peptide ABC transporter permease n=1 Tax=Paraglaciecola hydrolytica TaxID=1799789 RepID=A0A135ZYK7_9ALTE|nr:FtsX-like permease family protein [Paraglaciecola hydrolytica]KXI28069.1 peptide ABC transporter permease [Paraglaciecola hydrolytica]